MKRFEFSLQAVHNVREIKREAAERELVLATRELSRANEQLQEVLQHRESAVNEYLALHQSEEVHAHTIATHMDYIGSLLENERFARSVIRNLEKNVDVRRGELTEASRQSETTANLRERQRDRYRQELAREEQKILDEMAVIAVTRKLVTEKR
ncbi:MAG TPA: flagellar export protein FliJ [Pyrinomonadaceae bacterium]|nr:flagellar export protein FliJ [Pyrinomonadaceae bacterium]